MLSSHSSPLWRKGYVQRREPCSPHALIQEDPTKENKAKSDKTQILWPSHPLTSVSVSRKLPESTLSPMSEQMLTWLVSMNGTPSSMVGWFKHILFWRKGLGAAYNATMPSPEVGWRIRLETLPLIGLIDSGFQSIYFMKNLRWRMKWVMMIVVQKTVTMTVTVRVMSTVEKKTVTVTMTAVYEIDVYSECDQCGDE